MQLEQLAVDIGSVVALSSEIEDAHARALIREIVEQLRTALDEVAALPGLLEGEMPWWRDWSARDLLI